MATKLIQDTTLTNIANAIREKTETTESLKPTAMADAIQSIEVSRETIYEDKYRDMAFKTVSYGPKDSPETSFIGLFSATDVEEILQVAREEGATIIRPYAFQYAITIHNNDDTLTIPEGYIKLEQFCFGSMRMKNLVLPSSLTYLAMSAFDYGDIDNIYFKSKPSNGINGGAFSTLGKYESSPLHIYVPWAKGDVSGAPWGAGQYTTVHYGYTYTG